ncbi:MAG: DNA ligase [Candidatus Pacearchaeota archaeon]|nr:MAG: DNA ligase [Candidatus Pacearchaeota archaeon]
MKYEEVVDIYEKVGSTTKRLEKISILSNFLKKLDEKDKEVLYLLLGRVYPEYDERKIGISSQLAIKSISKAFGIDEKEIIEKWKTLGDLGDVAENLSSKKKQTTLHKEVLTTEKIIENLRKLPELQGKGTIEKKIYLIVELLNSASPLEAKYIVRLLLGDLRIGIKESTIRDSLGYAFFDESSRKEAIKKIQNLIDSKNDIAAVFEVVKSKDLKKLSEVKIEVGKPVKVMLAQKVKTIKEAFEYVGKPCAIEYKYDGFRLLIHKKGNEVSLFTRRLENVTKQFPEVVEYVKDYIKGDSFIIDSEAVGFDKKTKEYRPFQEISQRIKRKYDIENLKEQLPVEVNAFDLLYYNGESLIDKPFKERAKLLRKIIKPQKYKIVPAKQIITSSESEAERFYKEALKEKQEGVMFKNLEAVYQPGSRVGHMLKVKPEEKDFDLVITGAEYGTGKRSGWLSSFVLSCRDKNKFLDVGKVGTGVKEKKEEGISFEELTEKLKPYILEEKGKEVKIKPKVIVSVTYQEIQKSPTYSSGFALRFPRITALRPDKPLSEITTLNEIKKEFESQKRNYLRG